MRFREAVVAGEALTRKTVVDRLSFALNVELSKLIVELALFRHIIKLLNIKFRKAI